MNYGNIPQEMKKTDRWVCWRKEKRRGKFNNVPKMANGRPASHSNKETWTSFNQANSARKIQKFNGISFALGDGFCGFDFDNVYDKENGQWHEPSRQIIELLADQGAYVEFSPSGSGVHAILWIEDLLNDNEFVELKNIISIAKTGFKKEWKDNSGAAIEFYHSNRILTTTGDKIDLCNPDFSNGHHKSAVKEACKSIISSFKLKKKKKQPQKNVEPTNLSDDEVLKVASSSHRGTEFQDLYSGNWHDHAESQSSADMTLFNMLAHYTGKNSEQTKRLFEQSKLYREDKGETYVETSIQKAMDYCTNVYVPKKDVQIKTRAKVADRRSGPVEKVAMEKETKKEKQVLPSVYIHNRTIDDTVEPRKSNEVASDVMKHIEKADPNELKIFVKETRLGRIRYNTTMKRVSEDYSKEVTASIFEEFNREDIRGSLNRIANFYKLAMKDDTISEILLADPPTTIGTDIIHHQNLDNVPYLIQIINHPIVTKDWKIINEPGYHKDSQMYLEPSKLVEIEDMDIEEAYNLLSSWLSDFPFKDYSDLCNTLALLITMLIRPALPEGELPPLFIITANSQGAGKSTLAQILSAVIIGEAAGSTQLPTNEEEIRKAIGAELILGTEVVVLDNITEQVIVASSSLASAISEPTIRFRILGKSKMIHADNTATYVLTGNNVDANADLVDRACFIRLDTEKRVAERSFKTESILSDTIKKRQKLFSAVYVIVKSWIDRGKQRGEAKHRSNVWAKYISGIFDMLDNHINDEVEDDFGNLIRPLQQFLTNDTDARRKANPEFADWCSFRDRVVDSFGEEPWTVSDVFEFASFRDDSDDENLLGSWFKGSSDYHENARRQNLGLYFRANIDKVFGHWKLISNGKKDNRNAYSFKNLQEDEAPV